MLNIISLSSIYLYYTIICDFVCTKQKQQSKLRNNNLQHKKTRPKSHNIIIQKWDVSLPIILRLIRTVTLELGLS